MKKKSKILIASCILAVILSVLIASIVIIKLKSNGETSEESAQVWKEIPFDYSAVITRYDSYKEPFCEAVTNLRQDLDEVSKENECAFNIVSAYMTENDTPTLIIVYDNPEGGNNAMICKYANNMLYKTFVHGGKEKFGSECELLIVQDSDVIAFRSGVCESTGTQTLYDFDGNVKYSTKWSENFDVAPFLESMDQMLAEYLGIENPVTISYSESAIYVNVDVAIDNFVKD